MQILSFDTASHEVQIALMQDGVICLEERLCPPASNRQESASLLLPGIDAALKRLAWQKGDLDFIVVGAGPGSFTGLRVATVTARSIAQALGLGVLAVCRLEVLAGRCPGPCAVVLAAGAGQFYLAAYGDRLDPEPASCLVEPLCCSLSEMQDRLRSFNNCVVEPGMPELSFASDKNIVVYPADANLASDGACLAFQRISYDPTNFRRSTLSEAYPWDNVLPLYLRSPSVTLKKNGSSNKTIAGG
jgi:tRNA threonylcarbamoyl adenosine modification protein YeaZ